MPFSDELKNEIFEYCNRDLPDINELEKQMEIIQNADLKKRIIQEFKAIRFAYKLYEGIEAKEENLIFEVRNQLLAYASIYEAIIESVLSTYYSDTKEYNSMMTHKKLIPVDIPADKREKLKNCLQHNGEEIFTYVKREKRRPDQEIKFKEKIETAKSLGLIHDFIAKDGELIRFPEEIEEIYGIRNGIHLIAERKKNITYEIELSKKAYWRMQPFMRQIIEKLKRDEKITIDNDENIVLK